MKKQIARISLLHNAKLMAVIYFVISLPILLMFAASAVMQGGMGGPLLALLFTPLLYAAFGFVLTLFGAWVYNGIAARIGGFEFTTVEAGAGKD